MSERPEDFAAAPGSPAYIGARRRLHNAAKKALERGRSAVEWEKWARVSHRGDVSLIGEAQLDAIVHLVWLAKRQGSR